MATPVNNLEDLLWNHRRALIGFMENWSRQQENMLSMYAVSKEHARQEISIHAVKEPAPPGAESGASLSEPVASADRVAMCGSSQSGGDGAQSSSNSVPLQLARGEVEGIRSVLSKIKLVSESTQIRSASSSKGSLQMFVESGEFGIAIAFVIIANVLFMAIVADHMLDSAQTGRHSTETIFTAGEIIFTSIYVIELSLKLICFRAAFFCGSEWKWNVFDLIVVLSALVDLIPRSFTGDTINVSYLRLNRAVKLFKMMRIVKVYRSFKQLRLIIASFLGCARTMLWAFALLTTVIFTFSLIFVQAVTDYTRATHPDDWNADIMLHWGSTRKAMNTLFQASTGGEDWARTADPLWDIGWMYYSAFLIYICFFMFVVVNVLTAVFVDAALDSSMKDDSILIGDEIRHKMDYVRHFELLYHRLDYDGSGQLSWDKFREGLNSPEMVAFASTLEIEISDIREFFRLISSDGRDRVDLESFVVGCMKLKGPAKSLDVVSLLHRTKHTERVTVALAKETDRHLQEIQRLLSRVVCEQERSKGITSGRLSIEAPDVIVSDGLAASPRGAFDCDEDISI